MTQEKQGGKNCSCNLLRRDDRVRRAEVMEESSGMRKCLFSYVSTVNTNRRG